MVDLPLEAALLSKGLLFHSLKATYPVTPDTPYAGGKGTGIKVGTLGPRLSAEEPQN